MRFQWDPEKDRRNQRKHGIAFEIAQLVFADPFAITALEREVDGEERWQTVGMIPGMVILLVAHTEKEESGEEIIRIISARRASRTEREDYQSHRAEAQERD